MAQESTPLQVSSASLRTAKDETLPHQRTKTNTDETYGMTSKHAQDHEQKNDVCAQK